MKPVPLDTLAEKITTTRDHMTQALRRSLGYAKEIGECLLTARDLTNYSDFVAWCQGINIGEGTAKNYMRIAREWNHLQDKVRVPGPRDRT